MSQLKKLVLVSFLASTAVLASVSDAEAAKKKRVSRAAVVDNGTETPTRGGMVGRGGTPKWVQYDQGGMYYYQRNELEKARQYWLEALRGAEMVVPLERAKGLSTETERNACILIGHLTMFVTDSKLNPKGASYANQGYGSAEVSTNTSDPRRRAYDGMVAQMKMMRDDLRWFDRIEAFAGRAVGKENQCLRRLKEVRGQMDISKQNCEYTMTNLERELNIARSSVSPKPIASPGSAGVGPNGEYVPPGTKQ